MSAGRMVKGAGMALQGAPSHKNPGEAAVQLDPALHRRVLGFLNDAVQPDDLMFENLSLPNPEMDHAHEGHEVQEDRRERRVMDRRRILGSDIATEIIEFR